MASQWDSCGGKQEKLEKKRNETPLHISYEALFVKCSSTAATILLSNSCCFYFLITAAVMFLNQFLQQFTHLHGYYGTEVSGSTIGIVGMGKIGSAVAKRANGFGMKVLYHNRNRREDDEKQFGEIFVILRGRCPNFYCKATSLCMSLKYCSWLPKKVEKRDHTIHVGFFLFFSWQGRGGGEEPLNLPTL